MFNASGDSGSDESERDDSLEDCLETAYSEGTLLCNAFGGEIVFLYCCLAVN